MKKDYIIPETLKHEIMQVSTLCSSYDPGKEGDIVGNKLDEAPARLYR